MPRAYWSPIMIHPRVSRGYGHALVMFNVLSNCRLVPARLCHLIVSSRRPSTACIYANCVIFGIHHSSRMNIHYPGWTVFFAECSGTRKSRSAFRSPYHLLCYSRYHLTTTYFFPISLCPPRGHCLLLFFCKFLIVNSFGDLQIFLGVTRFRILIEYKSHLYTLDANFLWRFTDCVNVKLNWNIIIPELRLIHHSNFSFSFLFYLDPTVKSVKLYACLLQPRKLARDTEQRKSPVEMSAAIQQDSTSM